MEVLREIVIARGRGRGRGRGVRKLFLDRLKEKVNIQKSNVIENSDRFEDAISDFTLKKNSENTTSLQNALQVESRLHGKTVCEWKKDIREEKQSECICNREVVEVCCPTCLKTFIGRPYLPCNLHKNVIHLMDYRNCPHCKVKL